MINPNFYYYADLGLKELEKQIDWYFATLKLCDRTHKQLAGEYMDKHFNKAVEYLNEANKYLPLSLRSDNLTL